MTAREAWMAFARLNPSLRDGHSGIAMGNRAALLKAHVQACARVLAGAISNPAIAPLDERVARAFDYRMLDGNIGDLRAGDFDPELGGAFAAFTERAFADLEARGMRALIIDVRDNGGGDDPLWQNGLMAHVARVPYTHVGRIAIRVTAKNADPGDVIGDVQRRENKKRIAPRASDPLHFTGPVYLLAGGFSYSSTIQLLVAAQDFGIAQIAGRETGGLSCQTGKVATLDMPRTGLHAYTPVAAFIRPSGRGCERGVIPDVALDDDGLDPARAGDARAAHRCIIAALIR